MNTRSQIVGDALDPKLHTHSNRCIKSLHVIKTLTQLHGENKRICSLLPIRQLWYQPLSMPHPYGHPLYPPQILNYTKRSIKNCKRMHKHTAPTRRNNNTITPRTPQLQASQIRQNAQHPSHQTHKHQHKPITEHV